jgi:alpha/beta hydrolase fold
MRMDLRIWGKSPCGPERTLPRKSPSGAWFEVPWSAQTADRSHLGLEGSNKFLPGAPRRVVFRVMLERSGLAAVAGDSVGGGMTAALALMASERGDVRFVQQSMYYPVTDARMDTASYEQFAEGYFLTAKAMAWFWDGCSFRKTE